MKCFYRKKSPCCSWLSGPWCREVWEGFGTQLGCVMPERWSEGAALQRIRKLLFPYAVVRQPPFGGWKHSSYKVLLYFVV